MFCKYCGKELKEDAVFCPYCGRNQKTAKRAGKQKNTPRESAAVHASEPTTAGETEAAPAAEPSPASTSEPSSTGFTFRDPDVEEPASDSAMPEEETTAEDELFEEEETSEEEEETSEEEEETSEEEEETSEEDMHRYAAMNQKAAQNAGTASDQPFDSIESVQRIFGGGVFLLLTVLLTLYIPLHLLGIQSMLTFLLTIPTIILCIGCWVAFAGCHSKQMGAGGLAMISGGLVAQVAFFLVEGIALAVLAFYSFYVNFLYPIGDILDGPLFPNASSEDLYMKALPVVLAVCAMLIACGAFLCHALRLTRRGAFLAKRMVRGETAGVIRTFRVQRTMGFVVVAAACYVVKLLFSSGIYRFFRILLIPYQAIAEGLMESLFGISGGDFFTTVRNAAERFARTTGTSELKDFFLKSFSTGGTEIVAGVVLILVLICVIILLLLMRRNLLHRN